MKSGSVAIVGAGPGDPELITVKGLKRLTQADVVVYDRLVSPLLLQNAGPAAERVYVGKAAGYSAMSQRDIEQTLIDRARRGARVVRLKGGDPFVFGRGAEELAALVEAGIDTEVIPGLSSAFAVPASASIPVTHREFSSSVTVVTGHEDPSKLREWADWNSLAASAGTLVILMGFRKLDSICERLIGAGRAPDTPAAVISNGTLPDEQVVTAPLARLPEAARAVGLRSPATIIVGDVVRYREMVSNLGVSTNRKELVR